MTTLSLPSYHHTNTISNGDHTQITSKKDQKTTQGANNQVEYQKRMLGTSYLITQIVINILDKYLTYSIKCHLD